MLQTPPQLTIDVQDVSVIFQAGLESEKSIVALNHIGFSVNRGEIVSVLGPNGCGKSTLLSVMSGLLEPTQGKVIYPSSLANGSQPRRGVVFQDFGLFYWMTVWQNIEFGLKPLGYTQLERREIVQKFVNLVGLRGFEGSYPYQLSGGMQQRVAIARALAISPEYLFLDEPFASLDLQTRDLMQEEFLNIWQHNRPTTVLVTHSIEESIYLSHKIVVLTRRPGCVKLIISVPLSFPRQPEIRLTSEFQNIKALIWTSLREEINGKESYVTFVNS